MFALDQSGSLREIMVSCFNAGARPTTDTAMELLADGVALVLLALAVVV